MKMKEYVLATRVPKKQMGGAPARVAAAKQAANRARTEKLAAKRTTNRTRMAGLANLTFRPATSERWADLETLFGARGACGGCWCMWWRESRREFVANKGDGNRRALRKIVLNGGAPGILAYDGGEAVGWCAIAPRDAYPRLGSSRILKPVDAAPVWSVTCFFVAKPYRRSGVTVGLLQAAIGHARKHGAQIVEGYPVDHGKGSLPDPFVYTGLASAFRKAGFTEVARRSATRPIMRYAIDQPLRGTGRGRTPAASS